MSEERAGYHTANDSVGDAQPDNVRVLPARGGFAQIDNAYFDRLIGVLSPTTYYCLMYLVRRTVGYRTESVKASLAEIAEATKLSRHTIIKALDDLKSAGIIASDADERGRTQVRTLTVLPVIQWRVTAPAPTAPATDCPTSAKSALVPETPQLVQKMHQTSAKNALVTAPTSAKNAPLLNTKRNTHRKDTDADASRTADADATPMPMPDTSSSQPSAVQEKKKRPTAARTRKLTDEQLEAHRVEAAWCSALLADYCAALDVTELPKSQEGKERQAAHWFYGQLAGVEDGAAKVMACYRLLKRDPFWQNRPLSLQKLTEHFPEYRRDPKGFREHIEQAAKPRASYPSANGRAPQPEPPRLPIGVRPLNSKAAQPD